MRAEDRVAIGTFANAARMTVKALRHYQRTRLLEPAAVDSATGYRYYSWDQLETAVLIATLRELDVPIESIRAHLGGHLTLTELATRERTRRLDEIASASTALITLDELLDAPAPVPCKVDVVEHPEIPTWALSRTVDADTIDSAAAQLVGELLHDAAVAGADTAPAVWGEYPIELRGMITITAHLPIDADTALRPPPTVARGVIPAGAYARALHRGPVTTVPFSYRALIADLTRRRQEADGPVFERYLTDPTLTPRSDNLVELLHPIRRSDPADLTATEPGPEGS